jgi:hypothetical protein
MRPERTSAAGRFDGFIAVIIRQTRSAPALSIPSRMVSR